MDEHNPNVWNKYIREVKVYKQASVSICIVYQYNSFILQQCEELTALIVRIAIYVTKLLRILIRDNS